MCEKSCKKSVFYPNLRVGAPRKSNKLRFAANTPLEAKTVYQRSSITLVEERESDQMLQFFTERSNTHKPRAMSITHSIKSTAIRKESQAEEVTNKDGRSEVL